MWKLSIKKGFRAALDLNNALYGRDSQQNIIVRGEERNNTRRDVSFPYLFFLYAPRSASNLTSWNRMGEILFLMEAQFFSPSQNPLEFDVQIGINLSYHWHLNWSDES